MKYYLILLFISISTLSMKCQIVKAQWEADTHMYGFIDENNNWIVKPTYKFAWWSSQGNYGMVSIDEYDYAEQYSRFALIDAKGNRFTDYIYSGAFCNWPTQPIQVEKNFQSRIQKGVINRRGRTILPLKYDEINIWDPSYYTNLDDGPYHPYYTEAIKAIKHYGEKTVHTLYNWKGEKILDKEYDDIIVWTLQNPTYRVQLGNKYGLYTTNGKMLLDCIYDEIKYSDNSPVVVLNNKVGVFSPIDKKFIIPIQFEEVKPSGLEKGFFIVKDKGLYGLYGDNKLIIPCKYSEFSIFKNDVAMVVLEGKVELLKNPTVPSSDVQLVDIQSTQKDIHSRAISRYPSPNSDVDSNIPEATYKESSNKFAFIIANENYPDAPVPYALNDGRKFAEYCNKSFNIPSTNIFITEDATYANLISIIDKIKDLSDVYGDDASLIFYYAGHGVPSEQENSAFLFPIDGQLKNIKDTSYSLGRFYSELANLSFKESIVLIDACFSGANRDNEMIIPGRGISVKVKEEKPEGKIVALSASQGNETAHQLTEKRHGMFTYYLLKAIQESNGDITLGELSDYVIRNVKRQSVVINSKKQTPTVSSSNSIAEEWRNIKF